MTATRYRFRHQPIEIDAVQWTGHEDGAPRIQALAGDDMFQYVDPQDRENSEDPEATAAYRDHDRGGAWKPVYDGDWICRRVDTRKVFKLPNAALRTAYDPVPYTVDEAGAHGHGETR